MELSEALNTEELAACIGRSDLGTTFHSDRYALSDVKSAERGKVADFFLRYQEGEDHVRCLTMPGESWLFEAILLGRHARCQIIGLERSSTVYQRARLAMPANFHTPASETKTLQDRVLKFGHGEVHYSRVGNFVKPNGKGPGKRPGRSNRLLLMDVETYMGALFEDYGATNQEKKYFVEKFYRRNAIWLDYTGTLTPSVLQAVSRIGVCLDTSDRPKPVAITVMNCRDRFSSVGDRIDAIKRAQPALSIEDYWTYSGKGSVSMLTVCGGMA